MEIVHSIHLRGPHHNQLRIPDQRSESGSRFTEQEYAENLVSSVRYVEYFSDVSFEIDISSFPEYRQKALAVFLQVKNIKVI